MSNENLNLDYKEARTTWQRYYEIWKRKDILTICQMSECKPTQVLEVIKRGIKP